MNRTKPDNSFFLGNNIKIKDNWVDGGYDDYPNLAWAGVHSILVHPEFRSKHKKSMMWLCKKTLPLTALL